MKTKLEGKTNEHKEYCIVERDNNGENNRNGSYVVKNQYM